MSEAESGVGSWISGLFNDGSKWVMEKLENGLKDVWGGVTRGASPELGPDGKPKKGDGMIGNLVQSLVGSALDNKTTALGGLGGAFFGKRFGKWGVIIGAVLGMFLGKMLQDKFTTAATDPSKAAPTAQVNMASVPGATAPRAAVATGPEYPEPEYN